MRLAFVSAPGSSAYMEEILTAVGDAVAALGVEVLHHHGYLSEVADHRTVSVVVPHEYFAVAPLEADSVHDRTISFGVEHPGTETFEAATRVAVRLGARFEISQVSVDELASRDVSSTLFPLGYVPEWDRWQRRSDARGVDLVYLGTADARRVAILAQNAEDLAKLRTELLIPPHEPMTRTRPDFRQRDEKWALLADSHLLLNLHRDGKSAFEWVRGLEAMINGCVVITEPSDDLGPLRPGEHLLVAEPERIGLAIRGALADPGYLEHIRNNAYALCREQLSMAAPARKLLAAAEDLHRRSPAAGRLDLSPSHPAQAAALAQNDDDGPLAVWVPGLEPTPAAAHRDEALGLTYLTRPPSVTARTARNARPSAQIDVLCVQRPGDGPWRLTLGSVATTPGLSFRLASAEAGPISRTTSGPDVAQVLTGIEATHRGSARNALLRGSNSEYVAILDAGDRFLASALAALATRLHEDDGLDVAYPMASNGAGRSANMLIPEQRRLMHFAYLTRGYLVRRSFLESIGGFIEEPSQERYVDYWFWRAVAARAAGAELRRGFGVALWPHAQPGTRAT